MNNELNLIIIWEHGRSAQEKIVSDINDSFKICECIDLKWSPELFHRNLTRFYGQKLPNGSHKEKHCGKGRFVLITFIDESPKYGLRDTSRGQESVNTNVFDKKVLYREWTGGGHKVHTTNGEHETAHDLMLLLGRDVSSYMDDFSDGREISIPPILMERDIEGAHGWNDFRHLFTVANVCLPYVVMRNYENLPDSYLVDEHGDIDFLTVNAVDFSYIINATKSKRPFRPNAYSLEVDKKSVPCDIRQVGDGYYDQEWQRKILENAIFEQGFRVPCENDYLPMLAYHALIHKVKISKGYYVRLNMSTIEEVSEFVIKFLNTNNYKVFLPKDLSVYYNFINSKQLSKYISRNSSLLTLLIRKLRQVVLVDARILVSKIVR